MPTVETHGQLGVPQSVVRQLPERLAEWLRTTVRQDSPLWTVGPVTTTWSYAAAGSCGSAQTRPLS